MKTDNGLFTYNTELKSEDGFNLQFRIVEVFTQRSYNAIKNIKWDAWSDTE